MGALWDGGWGAPSSLTPFSSTGQGASCFNSKLLLLLSGQKPARHSPSALLQRVSTSQRGTFTLALHPGSCFWCSCVCSCHPGGYPLISRLRWPWEACVPESHRTITIRKVVLGRLPTPRDCRQLTETYPQSVKAACLFFQKFRH